MSSKYNSNVIYLVPWIDVLWPFLCTWQAKPVERPPRVMMK